MKKETPSLEPFKISDNCWFYEEANYIDLRFEDLLSSGAVNHLAIKIPYKALLKSKMLRMKAKGKQ